MLFRKDLKIIEANKNKNETKFKFQGQSARAKRWLDLNFDWSEVNFRTQEPDFYRKPFQIHNNTQNTNKTKIYEVPIINLKHVENLSLQCSIIVRSC